MLLFVLSLLVDGEGEMGAEDDVVPADDEMGLEDDGMEPEFEGDVEEFEEGTESAMKKESN